MKFKKIAFGPFFASAHATQQVSGQIVPLNLAMEWSSPSEALRIPLFCQRLSYAQDRIRLEHIVFRGSDLPCDMECQEYQAIHTATGVFLPLEGLLVALYRSCEIYRSVFQILNEFAAIVPLHATVTSPLASTGLLATEAERRGFRLNALFQESGLTYAQIGWEPECRSTRFHVCLASFRPGPAGEWDAGNWMAHGDIGVSQLLADELHRLVPGAPVDLLSRAGRRLLLGTFPGHLRDKSAPNKSANESSTKPGVSRPL
jgi:hypothetical protein